MARGDHVAGQIEGGANAVGGHHTAQFQLRGKIGFVVRCTRAHLHRPAQGHATQLRLWHLRAIDQHAAMELRRRRLGAFVGEGYAVELRRNQHTVLIEGLERQEQVDAGVDGACRVDLGEGVLDHVIEWRGGEKTDGRCGIGMRIGVDFQLAVLEVLECSPRALHHDIAGNGMLDPHRQSLIAKLRIEGDVANARPAFPIIEDHVLDRKSRQKQPAAIAEGIIVQRSAQHQIGMRHAAGDEGTIQPAQGVERYALSRQIARRGSQIDIEDPAGQRDLGRAAVVETLQREFRQRAKVLVGGLQIPARQQHAIGHALPVYRALQRVQRDRRGPFLRPQNACAGRSDLQLATALIAAHRAGNRRESRRPPDRGEANAGKSGAGIPARRGIGGWA